MLRIHTRKGSFFSKWCWEAGSAQQGKHSLLTIWRKTRQGSQTRKSLKNKMEQPWGRRVFVENSKQKYKEPNRIASNSSTLPLEASPPPGKFLRELFVILCQSYLSPFVRRYSGYTFSASLTDLPVKPWAPVGLIH